MHPNGAGKSMTIQAALAENGDRGGDHFSRALAAERPGLVRLCAALTVSRVEAEDLAQEALLEAWRVRERLRDIAAITPWLSAIVRNVCLRYRRRRSQDYSHLIGYDPNVLNLPELHENAFPFALAKDDSEVASILSHALATLPASTRQALEAAYVQDRPQAELARALQLSEAELRVRLHRGKRALKQILMGSLRAEALAAGLSLPEATGWTTTRMWCPWCGGHHLELRLEATMRRFAFRCSGACDPQLLHIATGTLPSDLTSPKSILARLCVTLGVDYRRALATGAEVCPRCGSSIRITRWPFRDIQVQWQVANGILLRCDKCAIFDSASPWHMALDTPQAQHFWRRHPRMRAIPVQEFELDGRQVLLTGFESAVGNERLEMISASDTFELLRIGGTGA